MSGLMFVPLCLMLMSLIAASVAFGQARAWNHALNMRMPNAHVVGVSSDIIPGVVVIKLKHSIAVPDGPVAHVAIPLMSALSERGVSSLVRAFPLAERLPDADVAAGKVDLSQIHYGKVPPGMNPVDVSARIAGLPQVEYAEPKYYSHLADVPNDSDYVSMQQVYLDRVKAPAAWALQKGIPSIVIATVDGGTHWQHPDLLDNVWVNPGEDLNHDGIFQPSDLNGVDDDHNGYIDDLFGWNFTHSTNNPRGTLPGSADHGTKTASIFGAVTNNHQGMAGTSWNCRIMPVCAADSAIDDIVAYGFEGIAYAAAMGANVINCSWHRRGDAGNYSQMEQDVITAATQAGALIVAAAGNSHQNNDESPYYPASYTNVLSVGATEDTTDAVAYFSDYGLNVSTFAPGMNIRVALDNGSYGTDKGTSAACPIVAGLAGLVKSAHPAWMPNQIAEQIRMTSDPIDGNNQTFAGLLGHGRVNFYRALSENHSGIILGAGRFHTRSGSTTTFVTGDTVILSLRIKNVLTLPAENLSFNVSTDPAQVPLLPIVGPTRLDVGAEDSLDIHFLVTDRARGQEVSVRVGWSANADDWDARHFKDTVHARTGYWKRQASPTTSPLFSIHAVDDRVAWAAGYYGVNSPAVLRTIDGGDNWAVVNGNLPNVAAVCVSATDSLHAWVGTYEGYGSGAIFATVDGGATWRKQPYPAPHTLFFDAIWFFDAANGYALGDPPGSTGKFVLLRTSDGGATWDHVANEPSATPASTGFPNSFWCTDSQHIWFGSTDSYLYRTNDGGATWSSAKVGMAWVTAIAMRDDSVGILCSASTVSPAPPFVARTTNGGTAWQTLEGVKPDGGYAAAFPRGSTDAWVSGYSTVAWSHDSGENWAVERTDPPSGYLWAMSFSDPANGWIVTSAGEIFRRNNPATSVTKRFEHEELLPGRSTLEQNYPNPFNPTTTIKYELPKLSTVRLSVYDILGREVAVLVNEKNAPGRYEVRFNATGLASGVYLYRLTAGSFVQSRKMVIVK